MCRVSVWTPKKGRLFLVSPKTYIYREGVPKRSPSGNSYFYIHILGDTKNNLPFLDSADPAEGVVAWIDWGSDGAPTGLRQGFDGLRARTVGSADPAEPKKGRLFLVSPKTYIYRGDLSGGAHPPIGGARCPISPVEWASTTVAAGFGRESVRV